MLEIQSVDRQFQSSQKVQPTRRLHRETLEFQHRSDRIAFNCFGSRLPDVRVAGEL